MKTKFNYSKEEKKQWKTAAVILPALIILFFLIDIILGAVKIPISDILKILFGTEAVNESWSTIISYRTLKALAAIGVGVALAVSGVLMQAYFRNPLAGPFVLGISSGASLGVALLVLLSYSWQHMILVNTWTTPFAALSGALIVFLIIIIVSTRIKNSMALLIVGLMVASGTGALVSLLQFYSQSEQVHAYVIWTLGNLGGVQSHEMILFFVLLSVGVLLAFFISKPLHAFQLGDVFAQSIGVPFRYLQWGVIISSSLLAGGVTAFFGPIAFVGIAIPHLARLFFHGVKQKFLLFTSAGIGAIFMLCCDILSQLPGQQPIPINVLTALLGAPIVIAIIINKQFFKFR